ncbi:hypothetical protein KKG44_00930 [Patescibacteria group bacterium]|nr:hypothetical protein [Patescibacteria group bacterium]MBU2459663.1 hypothetical protein [Patescibacteria group bacterium]
MFLAKRVSPNIISVVSFITLIIFLPLLLLAAYQTARILTRATGTRARITINTRTHLEPIHTDFYHAFAQGGEESVDMLAPVLSHVKNLSPQYIRIDHIYDHYDVVGKVHNSLMFNWGKLDETVETIRASGATPVFSLSYMPGVIAKDGQVTNAPDNWEDWALVVQKTIEHYSGKSGKNIPGVYYEVWNEPDLEQFGKWSLRGDKNYLTLYRYAASGANSATGVNRFFLGGPATTGLYKNWVIALVESGERLDFLSWHSYYPDPTRFASDQRNVVSWLMPYPQYTLIPKLITEFGFSGAKDTRYGSSYAAAYTASVVRQLISGSPTLLFSFQLKDGPDQGSGDGWGIITHEANGAQPKPRYQVYEFLDAMKGTRLALTGEGTWVTGFASVRDNTIRVLLVNFDQNGNHVETVPITFENLPSGTYTYHERLLLGRDVTSQETVSDTTLTKQVYMPAQSVAVLELTKQ